MKIEVNIQKKYAYIIIGLLVLLIGGVGVWAYGTSNPSNFGHTWNEIANKPNVATEEYVNNKAGNYITGGHYGKCKTSGDSCNVIAGPTYCDEETRKVWGETRTYNTCKCPDGFLKQHIISSVTYNEGCSPGDYVCVEEEGVSTDGYYTCIKE